MNILFTASTFDHIVRFHLRYIKELSERGHRVYVIGGGMPTQIPYAVESIFIPFEKRTVSVRDLAISKQIRQIVEEKHIDRIITHTTLASFYVRLAVMGMRKRPFVVCVVHGYLFDKHTNRLKYDVYLAAEKYVARVTDVLLTMNQWDYETAKRHRLGREVKKIPGMGVDFTSLRPIHTKAEFRRRLNEQYGIPENACLLLYGAEFSKRKNQKLLINVMKVLPESVYAIMAGNGDLIDECRQYAAQLGLSGRVLFPGYVNGLADYYQAADIVVSVSHSEGLPFHIMEAMYCAKPVICSRVKGHTDLITDGENGILVHNDDVDAFASAIKKLMDDPQTRNRLAERAKASVEQYSAKPIVPQIMSIYLQQP